MLKKKIQNHVISPESKLWTNNNCESINHRLKVATNWAPMKTDLLVEKMYELVRLQITDMRRAIHGAGNFMLNEPYSSFRQTEQSWASQSEEQKHQVFLKLLKADKPAVVPKQVISSDGTYRLPRQPGLARKPSNKTRHRTYTSTKRHA